MNDLPSLLSSHVSHRKTNRYIRLITKISDILANIRLRTKFGPRALAGLVFAEPQDGTVPDKRSPPSWSDFQAIGTDRWSRNRGKQGIQSGDLIRPDRNPL
jgi:hypothetical protein